jgi:hypothetical protein
LTIVCPNRSRAAGYSDKINSTVAERSNSKSVSGNMLVFATVLMMLISVVATISMAASSGNGDPNVDKVPILVKFKASAGKADIDNAIHSSGGESGRDLSQIRTHVIYVPVNARDRILEAYKNNPSVERANGAIKLQIAGIPNDPEYAQQWALPKIAWDTAYNT